MKNSHLFQIRDDLLKYMRLVYECAKRVSEIKDPDTGKKSYICSFCDYSSSNAQFKEFYTVGSYKNIWKFSPFIQVYPTIDSIEKYDSDTTDFDKENNRILKFMTNFFSHTNSDSLLSKYLFLNTVQLSSLGVQRAFNILRSSPSYGDEVRINSEVVFPFVRFVVNPINDIKIIWDKLEQLNDIIRDRYDEYSIRFSEKEINRKVGYHVEQESPYYVYLDKDSGNYFNLVTIVSGLPLIIEENFYSFSNRFESCKYYLGLVKENINKLSSIKEMSSEFSSEEKKIATSTARGKGCVGKKAITPRYVALTLFPGETILNFGAGVPDSKTGIYYHSEILRNLGAEVTEYDFGDNRIGELGGKYDTVFASNVLNVQVDEKMLRRTLKEIKGEALKIIRGRGGFTDSLNAQGQDVRPATGQSWMNCENMAEERQPSKLCQVGTVW